jgi:hypothetical protein
MNLIASAAFCILCGHALKVKKIVRSLVYATVFVIAESNNANGNG